MTSQNTPQKIPRLTRSADALTSSQRWQAITRRDPSINSFVYAVLTTKIYCRPSCAARLARRANIQFYDTPSQAEQEGFRACKRCRPQTGGTALANHPQTAIVDQACETIQAELAIGLKPRLQKLAAQAGLTPSHFHRVFKKRMGVTPGQYASGLVQGRSSESASPEYGLTSDIAPMSESGTPRLEVLDESGRGVLNLEAGESLLSVLWPVDGSPVVAGEPPVVLNEAWNDFDAFLAVEPGQHQISSMEDPPLAIDPQVILASGV
ncbi:Bifunctional transcriptional activator/DNA repair enzyme Ada [Penicillium rolfsii]|nr:Bifunctional transcriptional activator/DNA repair enzyme Ada [Penicillium rolfsii]